MIAAAVLTKEEVVLEGCPKISDVEDMAEIVRSLGGTVWWERNALHMNCEKIEKSRVEGALSKRLRASLLFLGSLLARTGEAYLAGAGGCRIGKRPTDLHQRAMELLGAEVFEEDGTIRAKADHPKGAVLCFPKKSVGATENAVLFAVGAEGATRLEHCAREPEVVHLCRFLKAMGAEITGEGTEQITVYGRQGKRLLSGCRYRVPGDRIAAGTYLLMGAATRGQPDAFRRAAGRNGGGSVPLSENRWTIYKEEWYTGSRQQKRAACCSVRGDRGISRFSDGSAVAVSGGSDDAGRKELYL